ncbi:MAG: hypothetical protein UR85_C0002G0072 [Candidatus Nomurabacteria bacterium GW2011_GWF2_35_66]|uniref:Uncharacterized protein n=1 Tax=Candidatus Nomurabacteria bacterium GW2011_GWE1_35_16 TaxID=1618761 RepID=A0A0G0BSL8_9BACT|nr:MAG: hypothetical protein UR55_C0004G0032 [Candidatus Nomurabacteria bacterium GW2011_GWF1_34_20]KKP63471.1 MAG: hypothetical protein UR57_C0004G0032 [Candidatus Nomurabacteria bacterium GW2011_GWE2_34_25]KKP66651.1 MAG: hypothetical protein UR64_C0004G0032 [Candidatus Nomurabacteria bacterium GW2011_GWE1_35_16]KKP83759.1 MAG: hypothetical protein UR85_C0002G0072 [Candidatus Nomurabacteria bacterium GW2011_GWF2_35_66]HAE36450.1 hypothetical protein [Candidatus Nomurabacteria bacterium]
MKKKQIVLKIISGIIVFSFVISFSQFALPKEAGAAELNWDNPNKKGDNPYKINTDAILNPSTMMQVVGCTGLVDKVTSFTTDFLSNQANKLIQSIWKKKAAELAKNKSCKAVKASIVASMAGILNTEYATALTDKIDCKDIQGVTDTDVLTQLQQDQKKNEAARKRSDCFDGLAYTMAKNQLTSMTRQTINWVNSGFNGDPMYVRNMTSFTNTMGKNIIEGGINVITNPITGSPYGSDFSRTAIRSYRSGRSLNYGAENFLYSLSSDLGNFITNPKSYYKFSNTGIFDEGYYGPNGEYKTVGEYESSGDYGSDGSSFGTETTKSAVEKAKESNNIFSNDFSTGGWDGWLALTQRDQNNPLGFSMAVSQYLEDQRNEKQTQVRDELLTNSGFLSQKKCLLWQRYDDTTGKPAIKTTKTAVDTTRFGMEDVSNNDLEELSKQEAFIFNETQMGPNDKCIKDETVTPGSIIKDKLTNYVNSPERQLELADTINESLNSLFTSLIEKFRNEGLLGLSREKYAVIDNMGAGEFGFNSAIDTNNDGINDETTNDGAYNNSSFDITRDLGNTYVHNKPRNLGTWNAKTNEPELHTGLGPYLEVEKSYPSNVYYTVSIAGNTKLYNNGYTGWAIGDRAFWNGKEWQNWKAGTTDPVDQRGVIQIQKDYSIAIKDLLKVIPSIMPRMGELDYCIPGPNPYFQNNSGDTAAAFNEFAGSLQSIYKDGSFFKRDTTTFSLAQPGSNVYEDYRNIFKDTPTYWSSIQQSLPWRSLVELGNGLAIAKDRAEERTTQAVDDLLNQIQNDIKIFYKDYNDKVFKGVYNTMTQEFLKKENIEVLVPNTAYIPMAEEGYNLTKDIVNYDAGLTTAVEDYNNAITQAESNAMKLNKIKSEVSKIILAAQDRRNIRLLEILGKIPNKCETAKTNCKKDGQTCLNEYNTCVQDETNTARDITKDVAKFKVLYKTQLDAFEKTYASCLEQEDITYYDTNDIMNDTYVEDGARCSDRRDNDLDGLIDGKDPDCIGH